MTVKTVTRHKKLFFIKNKKMTLTSFYASWDIRLDNSKKLICRDNHNSTFSHTHKNSQIFYKTS